MSVSLLAVSRRPVSFRLLTLLYAGWWLGQGYGGTYSTERGASACRAGGRYSPGGCCVWMKVDVLPVCLGSFPPTNHVPPPQLCSGRSRHIPVCEVMVCLLAMLWWIGCATTGACVGVWGVLVWNVGWVGGEPVPVLAA